MYDDELYMLKSNVMLYYALFFRAFAWARGKITFACPTLISMKKASKYDQEIPRTHTADQLKAP